MMSAHPDILFIDKEVEGKSFPGFPPLITDKYKNYNCGKRPNKMKMNNHRKGPVPLEDCLLTNATQGATHGTLDSECEELDFEEIRSKNANSTFYNKIRVTCDERGNSIASCRALIMYFSKLAKGNDEEEQIDLNFVSNLLEGGADINFPDKHGQTISHEVARGWHLDVMKFMLEKGADINKADNYGRTPLHLAAAVDYPEMVECLVKNGADMSRQTYEEGQTAMHYGAKNNSFQTLKVMLRMNGRINDRDYKRRTPLFVATEAACSVSARYLIEQGAPCGVYDSSGTPLLSLLIEKLPQIALEALEQFHHIERAFRKHYYYLGSLELDPSFLGEKIPEKKKERKEQKARYKVAREFQTDATKEKGRGNTSLRKCYARTPLEVIVQYEQVDLIMHPVIQRLLYVKWQLFGKMGSFKMLAINLLYTLIWTILALLLPRQSEHYYQPLSENWWRIALEIVVVLLTCYFIFCEISQIRSGERKYNSWRHWKSQFMETDLKFCHPRWPEEEKYVHSELQSIRSYQRTYFRDPWNIFEWITYVIVCLLVLTRIITMLIDTPSAKKLHPRMYAIGLVVIWLRLMRSCRAFQSLGPFIAILGSVISDTLKFAFLFFEFFIPYTMGFWIIYGDGHHNVAAAGSQGENRREQLQHLGRFHDLVFNVWSMTLMGNFDWQSFIEIDRYMAQILCGTYFALVTVVCMNLYIALLSDTFARVYGYAQANAFMQQAKTIIFLEGNLAKLDRCKFGYHMQEKCNPQEVYLRDDVGFEDDNEQDMLNKVCRRMTNRIDELQESLDVKSGQNSSHKVTKRRGMNTVNSLSSMAENPLGNELLPAVGLAQADLPSMMNFVRMQTVQSKEIHMQLQMINDGMTAIRSAVCGKQKNSQNNSNNENSNNEKSSRNSNQNTLSNNSSYRSKNSNSIIKGSDDNSREINNTTIRDSKEIAYSANNDFCSNMAGYSNDRNSHPDDGNVNRRNGTYSNNNNNNNNNNDNNKNNNNSSSSCNNNNNNNNDNANNNKNNNNNNNNENDNYSIQYRTNDPGYFKSHTLPRNPHPGKMHGTHSKDSSTYDQAIRRFSQVSRREDFDFDCFLEQGKAGRSGAFVDHSVGEVIPAGMGGRPIETQRGPDSGRITPQKRRRRRKNKFSADNSDGGCHAHVMSSALQANGQVTHETIREPVLPTYDEMI